MSGCSYAGRAGFTTDHAAACPDVRTPSSSDSSVGHAAMRPCGHAACPDVRTSRSSDPKCGHADCPDVRTFGDGVGSTETSTFVRMFVRRGRTTTKSGRAACPDVRTSESVRGPISPASQPSRQGCRSLLRCRRRRTELPRTAARAPTPAHREPPHRSQPPALTIPRPPGRSSHRGAPRQRHTDPKVSAVGPEPKSIGPNSSAAERSQIATGPAPRGRRTRTDRRRSQTHLRRNQPDGSPAPNSSAPQPTQTFTGPKLRSTETNARVGGPKLTSAATNPNGHRAQTNVHRNQTEGRRPQT